MEWTVIADESSLNGCNGEIIIPEYDIKQKLIVGENVITFTPTNSGTFGYSCWMGMIRSSITVADDTNTSEVGASDSDTTTESSKTVDNTGLPQGCCSGGF